MKNCRFAGLFLLFMLFMTLSCTAQGLAVRGIDVRVLVDSAAFFPQLSPDGSRLLYSNTEGTQLTLLDLGTGATTVVAAEGYPGFDARFAPDGKVYYVTQQLMPGNLVYRTGNCYDPATGKHRVVLKPQHGAVHVVPASKGLAMVGEDKTFTTSKDVGRYAYTQGPTLFIVDGKTHHEVQPVDDCVGYLWASFAPSGQRVLFHAAAKGDYVTNAQGRLLQRIDYTMMPCWVDDDHIVGMTSRQGNVQRSTDSQLVVYKVGDQQGVVVSAPDEEAIQPMVAAGHVVYTTPRGTVKMMKLDFTPQP